MKEKHIPNKGSEAHRKVLGRPAYSNGLDIFHNRELVDKIYPGSRGHASHKDKKPSIGLGAENITYGVINSLKDRLTVFSFEGELLPPKLGNNTGFFDAVEDLKAEMERIEKRNKTIPYWIVIRSAKMLVDGSLNPKDWAEKYDENKVRYAIINLRHKCAELAYEYRCLEREFGEDIAAASVGLGRDKALEIEKRREHLIKTGYLPAVSLLSSISDDYIDDANWLTKQVYKNNWYISGRELMYSQLVSFCLDKMKK